eukprot:s1484_g10.t1
MHLLQALRHPHEITVRHTRSHVADPGNEVADALAKWACHRGGAVDAAVLPDIARPLPASPSLGSGSPTFQYQALWDGPSPPPELPTPAECASFFGLTDGSPAHTFTGKTQATICACLLTVNVQTLYPQDGDTDPDAPSGAFVGRARFLRDQLQAKGIAVTAVQETAERNLASHIRHTSEKHADGSGGVELWFSRDHAFLYDEGYGKPVLFQPDDFLAVYWNPRAIEDHLWTGLLAHFPAPESPKQAWLRKRIHAAFVPGTFGVPSPPGDAGDRFALLVLQCTCPCSGFLSIVHDCYRRQTGKDLDAYSVSLQDVPDLCSLEWALRDTATARAYGQDGVPGEVAHYCAAELSKALFQLQLKSVFRLCEPVQHKGGVLHCVWKRKGPKQPCTSYRGILVSSILGKSLHKLLRQKCVTALSTVTSPLQVGGLPRYPVTVPAHATRLFQSACHRRCLCHSIVFLDLQEAFYRIVRPLITGGPLTQEAIAAACRAVNLPSGVYHEIQAHLQQPALLQGAGASEWATRALAETLQDTWFKFLGEPELVVTTIGSRPGESLSDLVFSLLFAKVLARIRQALRAAGHVTAIPWHASMTGRLQPFAEPVHETIELLDSTWMDDLSLMLRAQDSIALLDRLCTGTAVLLDACLEHALLPNLGRGKTEALVMLRSSGTKEARRRLFIDEGGTLPLDCRLWPSARLRITPTHKHLGDILHHRGHLQREVKARAAQAWTAFNQRKQKVFASPAVAPRDNMLLFDTLVATVLFYGCGTWTSRGLCQFLAGGVAWNGLSDASASLFDDTGLASGC